MSEFCSSLYSLRVKGPREHGLSASVGAKRTAEVEEASVDDFIASVEEILGAGGNPRERKGGSSTSRRNGGFSKTPVGEMLTMLAANEGTPSQLCWQMHTVFACAVCSYTDVLLVLGF